MDKTITKNGIIVSAKRNPHYGCDLVIVLEETIGTEKGKQYKHIATVWSTRPETIFIKKHKAWMTKNEDHLMWLLVKMLSHEPIHHILWRAGNDPNGTYDVMRTKFKKKQKKILTTKSYKKMAGTF